AMRMFEERLGRGDLSRMDVALMIMGSPEYRMGLTQSWSQQFLGRAADAELLPAVLQMFDGGASDEEIIAVLVSSDEYFRKEGDGSVDVALNGGGFTGGVDEAVKAQLLSSPEYFDHSIAAHGVGGGAGKTPGS